MVGIRSNTRLSLGVTTLLAGLLSVASAQEARLPEFRKAFRPSRDPAAAHEVRRDSLKIVKGLDSVAVAAALLEADSHLAKEIAGFDKGRDRLLRRGTRNRRTRMHEEVTVLHDLQDQLRASMMALKEEESVLHLVREALTNRKLPFTLRLALAEKASDVHEESLMLCEKALKKSRDPGGQLVALAAIRGLQALARSLGEETTACLKSPHAAVREAAAATLVVLKIPESLKPLMTRLGKERGHTQQRLGEALEILTGEAFGASPDAWRKWSEGEGRAFFDGDCALGGGKVSEPPKSDRSFFGIPLTGRGILFVVDRSGSMGRDHPEGGTRMNRIIAELGRALGQLRRHQSFNIIPFEVVVAKSFDKKELVSMAAVPGARKWLQRSFRLAFFSGFSAYFYKLTRYDALELAFRFAGLPATDKYYQPVVDTIFYVSDGIGSLKEGEGATRKEIPQGTSEATLKAVRRWNATRHVVIHTIRVGGWEEDHFMRDLAAANGGRFVVDGK